MAGRRKHIVWGMALGAAANFALQIHDMHREEQEEFDFFELLGAAAIGAVVGVLPDILEPATSSWHRKSFHSFGLATTILAGSLHPKLRYSTEGRWLALIASAHCSHLILDSFTPRGIPWIHPKLDQVFGIQPLSFFKRRGEAR